MIGNKLDLEAGRQVYISSVRDWCESFSISYFEMSSLKTLSVEYVFSELTKMILWQKST